MVEIKVVKVDILEGCNVILGQSHFIKTVEDMYEAIVEAGGGIKFGIAFCESSGKKLIRSDGNDGELVRHAEKEAKKIGAGHSFIVFMKNGFPINVLNRIKNISEVCTIYAATANPLQVVVAETEDGRGILGVIDGGKPAGIEKEEDKKERKELLRKFGYKK